MMSVNGFVLDSILVVASKTKAADAVVSRMLCGALHVEVVIDVSGVERHHADAGKPWR